MMYTQQPMYYTIINAKNITNIEQKKTGNPLFLILNAYKNQKYISLI